MRKNETRKIKFNLEFAEMENIITSMRYPGEVFKNDSLKDCQQIEINAEDKLCLMDLDFHDCYDGRIGIVFCEINRKYIYGTGSLLGENKVLNGIHCASDFKSGGTGIPISLKL